MLEIAEDIAWVIFIIIVAFSLFAAIVSLLMSGRCSREEEQQAREFDRDQRQWG